MRAAAPIVRRLAARFREEMSRMMASLNWLQVLIAVLLMLLFALAGLVWPELAD